MNHKRAISGNRLVAMVWERYINGLQEALSDAAFFQRLDDGLDRSYLRKHVQRKD